MPAATRTARLLATTAVALTAWLVVPIPAATADTRAVPGNFTGYAFDTCDTPSQRAMNAWRRHSKYAGVGIYVSGMNRACSAQPNLTRTWVRKQAARGWRLLPLVVGRQASCSPAGYYVGKRISPAKRGDYAKARAQGAAAARGGVTAVRRLGIGRGSVIWYDLEHFNLSKRHCRASSLAFTSAWTRQLHRLSYRSGFYSSAASGIRMLDNARRAKVRNRSLPDYIWFAEWNGRPTVRSAYIPRAGWWPARRVHQYRGGHTERHGGVAINIDGNFMRTGRGTVAGKPGPRCGRNLDFRVYDRIRRGARGPRVGAAQCMLRQQDHRRAKPNERFSTGTVKAVRRFQGSVGLGRTGVLNRRTWTALNARGSGTPLLKVGNGGEGVRRLQRSLNAATGARIPVDGVFSRREMEAVLQYQRRAGLPRTGVVTDRTWRALRKGRALKKWSPPRRGNGLEAPAAWQDVPFSSGARSPGVLAERAARRTDRG
jgi:peptidoglycan hydrolase-like protein with peptidoglycan-binding domain